ncbi:hypothetical protein NMG60_11037156 [Bertholletia excelsa]
MKILLLLIFSLPISLSALQSSTALDTITRNQSITSNQTLISSGQIFELGFFTPVGSNHSFLGIWYKKYPKTVVWVANRRNPITDPNVVLTIAADGNLVLISGGKNTLWSSNASKTVENSVATLLDSGNFVLMAEHNFNTTENYIWQSFDYPSDTLLPGMKMGWRLNDTLNGYITAWKTASDPSPGAYTFRLDLIGLPQFFLRRGYAKKFRSGPWNGFQLTGKGLTANPLFKPVFVSTDEESYYTYELTGAGVTRFLVNEIGVIQRFILNKESNEWEIMIQVPNDLCDNYEFCGPNGFCRINKSPICECLQGFVPRSQSNWGMFEWSGGCIRRTKVECGEKGEGFVRVKHVRMPDLLDCWVDKRMGHKECREKCLKNCNCTAYAPLAFNGGGSGCIIWFGDLVDVRELTQNNVQQDIYLRMPASELDHSREKMMVVGIVVSTACGMLVICLLCCWIAGKKRKERSLKSKNEYIELPLFDLITIAIATSDFSSLNMIGKDQNGRLLLKWPKRFEITMGIARGILYLHQDSRLRIIHRDLKASNILLDSELNPKISNFGIARILGEIKWKPKQSIYLIFFWSQAWMLWNDGKALELIDSCIKDSYIESQVLRCIQVGLLCVQKLPRDRPSMPSIVFMLGNEGVNLPQPKHPGFFIESSSIDSDALLNKDRLSTEIQLQ